MSWEDLDLHTQNYDKEMKCNYPDLEIFYKCTKIAHSAPEIWPSIKNFQKCLKGWKCLFPWFDHHILYANIELSHFTHKFLIKN